MDFDRNKHSVGGSYFHLQFTPKYRRQIFRYRKVRELCRALFKKKACQLGVRLKAIEFGPDHVHLFVTSCRKYSAIDLAFHFKGFSSWYLRTKAWNDIKHMLWGKSFWSDGHFYESIGRVTTDSMKFYIERQQGRHWKGIDYDYYRETKQRQSTLTDFASSTVQDAVDATSFRG